jgi:hypothetical protein
MHLTFIVGHAVSPRAEAKIAWRLLRRFAPRNDDCWQ